jgi:hypothetical protein
MFFSDESKQVGGLPMTLVASGLFSGGRVVVFLQKQHPES